MRKQAFEANFDGLVGPTHNYAGLSYGNIASEKHALSVSNPRAAVLQGLEKMKLLADLGLVQGVLPPQERPDIRTLRRLGFAGSEMEILKAVAGASEHLLAACYSSSSMWAANAATVSPGADTADGRLHITPANLVSQFHRSIEPEFTGRVLRAIFRDSEAFVHHPALPPALHFSDEGAANHTRLCRTYGEPGLELFVFGREAFHTAGARPKVFPARQTREASEAIARLHLLDSARTVFERQNPDAIDSGVFHNDVISVGNQNVFFYHTEVFGDPAAVDNLKRTFSAVCNDELIVIGVTSDQVTLQDAVESYLFNSQLVSLQDGTMTLIAPTECFESAEIKTLLQQVVQDSTNPIQNVHYVSVRQSMKNGGGPACLRLRVVMTEQEKSLTHPGVYLDHSLYKALVQWANRHYRDRLTFSDLLDPHLPEEGRVALDALTQLLDLGSIYDFQRDAGDEGGISEEA
jgi:succinylarginine dihydrolase